MHRRKLNVLDAAIISAFFAEIGRVDVLFNCAGVVQNGTVERGRSRLRLRSQRQRDCAHDQSCSARHAGMARRLHHQHVVCRLERERRAEPLRVTKAAVIGGEREAGSCCKAAATPTGRRGWRGFIDHWQAECSACRLQSRRQAVRNRKTVWNFAIRCQEGAGAGAVSRSLISYQKIALRPRAISL